jgi:hypothetical protein
MRSSRAAIRAASRSRSTSRAAPTTPRGARSATVDTMLHAELPDLSRTCPETEVAFGRGWGWVDELELRSALEALELEPVIHAVDASHGSTFAYPSLVDMIFVLHALELVTLDGPCARLTPQGLAFVRGRPPAPPPAPRPPAVREGKWVLFALTTQLGLVHDAAVVLHAALARLPLAVEHQRALVAFLGFLANFLTAPVEWEKERYRDTAALRAAIRVVDEHLQLRDELDDDRVFDDWRRLRELREVLDRTSDSKLWFRLSWGF